MMERKNGEPNGKEAKAKWKTYMRENGLANKNVTHGEMYVARVEYNDQCKKFQHRIDPTSDLPKRMNNSDANKYYNRKFREYWKSNLDDNIPEELRECAVDILIRGFSESTILEILKIKGVKNGKLKDKRHPVGVKHSKGSEKQK